MVPACLDSQWTLVILCELPTLYERLRSEHERLLSLADKTCDDAGAAHNVVDKGIVTGAFAIQPMIVVLDSSKTEVTQFTNDLRDAVLCEWEFSFNDSAPIGTRPGSEAFTRCLESLRRVRSTIPAEWLPIVRPVCPKQSIPVDSGVHTLINAEKWCGTL